MSTACDAAWVIAGPGDDLSRRPRCSPGVCHAPTSISTTRHAPRSCAATALRQSAPPSISRCERLRPNLSRSTKPAPRAEADGRAILTRCDPAGGRDPDRNVGLDRVSARHQVTGLPARGRIVRRGNSGMRPGSNGGSRRRPRRIAPAAAPVAGAASLDPGPADRLRNRSRPAPSIQGPWRDGAKPGRSPGSRNGDSGRRAGTSQRRRLRGDRPTHRTANLREQNFAVHQGSSIDPGGAPGRAGATGPAARGGLRPPQSVPAMVVPQFGARGHRKDFPG